MIKCPICFKKSILINSKKSHFNNKKYELYFCKNCLLNFYTPLKFENIYENETVKAYAEFHIGRNFYPSWTLELIKILKKKNVSLIKKEIFEIGLGDGINYIALKEKFGDVFNYEGIELDTKSVKICKKRGINKVYNNYFDKSFIKKDKKYDYVICTEVLEHQTNPKEFLESIFKILKKNGILIISVPNREIFFYKYRNYGDVPPHHFLKFSKKNLGLIFNKIFNKKILYLNEYSFKNKNWVESSKIFSKLIFKTEILYFLFVPVVLIFRISDKIKGEGLILFVKNDN